ncbi:MAG TPA: glycosyltransferase family 39 protein, partial [Anaerolineae bacterium]|nr:glycosyltransferase family 39 protein [Anaerolineae bacterium]
MVENLAAANDRQARLKNGWVWLGWLLVIALVVTPRVFDLNIFYARDELAIWPWADQFALAVWAGDPAATLTASDYPGIPMFWAQTLFLTFKYTFPSLFPHTMLPFEALAQDRSIELLAERRLAAGLLVSLQLIAALWLVRRLFGWPVALLSAILLGLDPFSLSEARLLRLEMTSALFACLSLLVYLLYWRERRSWLLFVSGIMAGLGVSSKTSAGLIVPFIWLLLGLDFLWGTPQTWW